MFDAWKKWTKKSSPKSWWEMVMNPMGPKNLYKHHQLNKSKCRDVMFTPQKSNIDTVPKITIKKKGSPFPFPRPISFVGALQPSEISGVFVNITPTSPIWRRRLICLTHLEYCKRNSLKVGLIIPCWNSHDSHDPPTVWPRGGRPL